jgi:hypothetical protein
MNSPKEPNRIHSERLLPIMAVIASDSKDMPFPGSGPGSLGIWIYIWGTVARLLSAESQLTDNRCPITSPVRQHHVSRRAIQHVARADMPLIVAEPRLVWRQALEPDPS